MFGFDFVFSVVICFNSVVDFFVAVWVLLVVYYFIVLYLLCGGCLVLVCGVCDLGFF